MWAASRDIARCHQRGVRLTLTTCSSRSGHFDFLAVGKLESKLSRRINLAMFARLSLLLKSTNILVDGLIDHATEFIPHASVLADDDSSTLLSLRLPVLEKHRVSSVLRVRVIVLGIAQPPGASVLADMTTACRLFTGPMPQVVEQKL